MTYDDYTWVEMFHTRTLNKLTVPVFKFILRKAQFSTKKNEQKAENPSHYSLAGQQ